MSDGYLLRQEKGSIKNGRIHSCSNMVYSMETNIILIERNHNFTQFQSNRKVV